MSYIIPACPRCHSESVSFKGHTRHGKRNHKCRDCGRQFVVHPQWSPLSQENRDLIDRLLLERLSFAGIARVMQRSEGCIQRYVNQKAKTVPTQVEVTNKPKKPLTLQMDELWSFVDDKGNEQWVWLALDVDTREIVGVYIGDRSGESAQAVWNRYLPCIVNVR
ncbi:MAG: IS1 family transposase [Cyanobacteria bacterium P01_D01_bin.156]